MEERKLWANQTNARHSRTNQKHEPPLDHLMNTTKPSGLKNMSYIVSQAKINAAKTIRESVIFHLKQTDAIGCQSDKDSISTRQSRDKAFETKNRSIQVEFYKTKRLWTYPRKAEKEHDKNIKEIKRLIEEKKRHKSDK